jgi:hypothetical protein
LITRRRRIQSGESYYHRLHASNTICTDIRYPIDIEPVSAISNDGSKEQRKSIYAASFVVGHAMVADGGGLSI